MKGNRIVPDVPREEREYFEIGHHNIPDWILYVFGVVSYYMFLNVNAMIDYGIINDSIEYYDHFGYKRVESPWLVSKSAVDATCPSEGHSFELKHGGKCLVASGEQSMLYQHMKGYLPLGQFQTCTPCFRYEPFDRTHAKYFVKNELFKTSGVNVNEVDTMANLCLKFFTQYIPRAEIVVVDNGLDIVVDGHELGSYGIREHQGLRWIYGTAVAEPRLSTVLNIVGIN